MVLLMPSLVHSMLLVLVRSNRLSYPSFEMVEEDELLVLSGLNSLELFLRSR